MLRYLCLLMICLPLYTHGAYFLSSPFSSTEKASKAAFTKNQDFTLFVWNIQKMESSYWGSDLKELAQTADLILFQESIFTDQFYSDVSYLKGREWQHVLNFFMPTAPYAGTGLSMASSVAAKGRSFLQTEAMEPFVGSSKLSLFAYYPIEGSSEKLLVANIHGINFVSGEEFEYELGRIYKVLQKHSGPMIVAGDFNTWSLYRTEALCAFADDLLLYEVPYSPGMRKEFMGFPLDHVFTRGIDIQQIDDLSWVTSSDHIPLRLRLRLQ